MSHQQYRSISIRAIDGDAQKPGQCVMRAQKASRRMDMRIDLNEQAKPLRDPGVVRVLVLPVVE